MSPAEDTLRRVLAPDVVEALLAVIDERVAEAMTTDSQTPRWLTVEQAASYLGCSPKAIRGRIERGRLAALREGRRVYLDREALDAAFADRGKREYARADHKSPRTADTAGGTAIGGGLP